MKINSEPDPARQEELEALHEEIDRLTGKYRACVILCHLQGRTHAEAAGLLKCPTGTVHIRVSRARELLRDRLTRRGLAFSTALAAKALVFESTAAATPPALANSTIKAAMQVAAGKAAASGAIPAAAVQLAQGVLRTMTLKKTTRIAVLLLTAASLTWGVAMRAAGQRPKRVADGAVPARAAQNPRAREDKAGPKERARTIYNLRQILLAMHNYQSAVGGDAGRFPPAAIRKDAKPLLSWRVAILPWLDVSAEERRAQNNALYNQFRLDEPWDSPHNKPLLRQIPEVYTPVFRTDEPRGGTYYQVFTGPDSFFEDELGPKLEDIQDGTGSVLMVVEAGSVVPWTKPEDITFDKEKPLPRLGRQFVDGFFGAFGSGEILFLNNGNDPEVLRRLITRRGGEHVIQNLPGSDPFTLIFKRNGKDVVLPLWVDSIPDQRPPAAAGARPTPPPIPTDHPRRR
jgi:hypothetical protein